MMDEGRPIAADAYDRLADAFAAWVDTKPHNAHYDRPPVLSLLPPVSGRRVLDAGCGPGAYAEWMADHGAEVVALDVSPRMVEHARRRLGFRAAVHQADLGQPLDFLGTGEFDLVVSGLTLDYVRDWRRPLGEFFRVLRTPGWLVFSVAHPFDEFYDHHPHGSYFDVEAVEMTFDWPAYGVRERIPYFRRPLSAMLDPLFSAGFRLERMLEPRPTPEFRSGDARDYEKLMRQPGFLCVRAAKDAVSAVAGRSELSAA